MIVGEAPGAEEDGSGRPFVGEAGGTLTDLMEQAGIPRSRVYVSNTVHCLPPKVNGSAKPSAAVVKACQPWIEQEIALVRPAVLVVAGDTALRALLSPTFAISKEHGRVHFKDGRWVYPIFHPSYLLRNGNDPVLRGTFEEDLHGLAILMRVHAATLRSPWSLEAVAHLYRSTTVPHTPNGHSKAIAWHVHDQFALPMVTAPSVSWDIRGIHTMLHTPSAVQELLHRWVGRPVRLELENSFVRDGVSATILGHAD